MTVSVMSSATNSAGTAWNAALTETDGDEKMLKTRPEC